MLKKRTFFLRKCKNCYKCKSESKCSQCGCNVWGEDVSVLWNPTRRLHGSTTRKPHRNAEEPPLKTHFCPPLRFRNRDDNVLRALSSLRGLRGAPEVLFTFAEYHRLEAPLNATSGGSIDRGVPQDSMLGPIFLLIFINDFPQCSIFIYLIIRNSQNNRIKINSAKSHLITFSWKKNIEVGRVELGESFTNQINCTKLLSH